MKREIPTWASCGLFYLMVLGLILLMCWRSHISITDFVSWLLLNTD